MFYSCFIVNPGRMSYWISQLYLHCHVRLGQGCGDFFARAAKVVEKSKTMSASDKKKATEKIQETRKVFEVVDKKTREKKKFNTVTNALRPYVKVFKTMWKVRRQHLV